MCNVRILNYKSNQLIFKTMNKFYSILIIVFNYVILFFAIFGISYIFPKISDEKLILITIFLNVIYTCIAIIIWQNSKNK